MFLENMPIRRKLMTAMLLTSGSVLLLACAAFITYEIITLRKSMLEAYGTRAEIIAANSTAALAFQNEADATEVLGALKTDPRTVAACIYDEEGGLFARYPVAAPLNLFAAGPGKSGYREGYLEVFSPIARGERIIGTVYLRANLTALSDRYRAYAWLATVVIVGAILMAYLLSRILQKQISLPILALAGTADAISGHRDFSVRAKKFGEDELGSLTDAFNQMLAEIQAQDRVLKEKNRLLDSIMENMTDGIVVADKSGRMVYFNKGAERIIGIGMTSKASSEWVKEYGVFKEDKATSFREEELPLVLAVQGKPTDGVVQFLRNSTYPHGIFINVNGRPIRDEKGNPDGGLAVIRDMTQQIKSEAALKSSERNYREVFDKVNDAIYVHDAETGRILDINQRTCELVECTREDILEGDPNVFITGKPGYAAEDAVRWVRKAATEGPQLFEWIARTKKGREIWVEVSLKKAVIAGQDRVLALVRDISERKKLEDVTKAQSFVASILENVPNMIFVKDAKDLRFVMFNKAGEELLGVPKADLIGKNDYDFFDKKEADFFTEKDRKTLEGKKLLDIPEETLQTKDKGARTLHTKKIPILGKDGRPLYLMGISEDITEQKQQESLRIYTKGLEASNKELQDFIFVASHDLQEPLRKVQAFGNFLKEEVGTGISQTASDYLARIQDAARRMGVLIEDLLQLTRVTTKAKPFEQVDLSKVLEEIKGDLEMRLRDTEGRVEVSSLPELEADPSQMRQLFQNLVGNALKFTKPGTAPLVEVRGEKRGKTCRIFVKDNGIGFDQKYAEKIFNIFQRLHGQGEYEGTGIGLAICRKVVERHQGKIIASSKPGEGAVFEITLPLSQNQQGGNA